MISSHSSEQVAAVLSVLGLIAALARAGCDVASSSFVDYDWLPSFAATTPDNSIIILIISRVLQLL